MNLSAAEYEGLLLFDPRKKVHETNCCVCMHVYSINGTKNEWMDDNTTNIKREVYIEFTL